MESPKVSKVLKIDLYNETDLDIERRYIYDIERRGVQPSIGKFFRRYDASNYEYDDYKRNVLQNKSNSTGQQQYGGASSGRIAKIKAIHFNDDGSPKITYKDDGKENKVRVRSRPQQ